MRHQMANRKLGRTSSHRLALFRNQLASLIHNERIVTTLIKAKELRPIVEKMITLGKSDSVHNRRQAARTLSANEHVQKLFTDISPRFAERPGGYTRIIKLGPRRGDGAEMAILELVDYKVTEEAAAPAKGEKKARAKKEEAPAAEAPKKKAAAKPKKEAAEGEEKPKKATKKKKEE